MSADDVIGLVVALVLVAYLAYALVFPEKL